MSTLNDTTITMQNGAFRSFTCSPGFLVAHCPVGAVTSLGCFLGSNVTVGRGVNSDFIVTDRRLSKDHLAFRKGKNGFFLRDLGSRNGTFLNGAPVTGDMHLKKNDVVRAGDCVLVFVDDISGLLPISHTGEYGLLGKFYSALLINKLREAALSLRHVLLCGPTGTGKELAAMAIAQMGCENRDRKETLVEINAARFASHEEAISTLFGVSSRFFSNVDARQGLIQLAKGGTLHIDEVHNLSIRTQRSLLRVIETGRVAKMGEEKQLDADVKFVLSSNDNSDTCGLAHDLYARLRKIELEPLTERVADIPSIFLGVLENKLVEYGIPAKDVEGLFSADHFETLCLDGFVASNVRGLIDIADRIATHTELSNSAEEAIATVFGKQFVDGPVFKRHVKVGQTVASSDSKYEQHKQQIIQTYNRCGKNLSETVVQLKKADLTCSRRWLGVFLKQWGER